jgi:thiol-disulfide isomerase/thioredoxin
MRRTTLIVSAALVSTLVFGIVLTRRLVRTWNPDIGISSLSRSTGEGLTLQFSDKPVPLPDLQVRDIAGASVDPRQWADKVVLINFWATWCVPCRDEMPDLVALQTHYRDQLVIVGLSIDEGPITDVRRFVDEFRVNYPVAIVGEPVVRAFGGVQAVPATFVVDRSGKIVQRHIGRLQMERTEHEVRALAGLPTQARIERVPDTGQVLLANAAYATSIPGVDFTQHTALAKRHALGRMNREPCDCGCGLTVAQCRIEDPACDVSLPQARRIAEDERLREAPRTQ